MNAKVRRIKEMYPEGVRVKLISMSDPFPVPENIMGSVKFVDDMGTVHVQWDNGSNMGLIVGEDDFIVVN